jgi:hypothetical protein
MVPMEKTGKAHAYSVDGVTWLSVRARWQAEKDYTVRAGSSPDLGGPVLRPISWPAEWSASVKFEVEASWSARS